YIELNPVRARMTATPGDYPWSSYQGNAHGAPDPLIRKHDLYQRLGGTDLERASALSGAIQHGLRSRICRGSTCGDEWRLGPGTRGLHDADCRSAETPCRSAAQRPSTQ